MTRFSDVVYAAGFYPAAGYGSGGGNHWFVRPEGGDYDGKTWEGAFTSVQDAVDQALARDTIHLGPGEYDESVIVTGDKSNLTFIGEGNRGSVAIVPSTLAAEGMEVRADDVTMINVGVAGEATASHALRVYGARFRAHGCKYEGVETATAAQVIVSPGTVVQHAASGSSYYGNAADCLFDDCELAWGRRGIDLVSSDYGAVTEARIQRCLFHDIVTCHIRSNDVQGSNICIRGIWIDGCLFFNDEDNTAPTDYLLLNTTGDTGIVCRSVFATATFDAATITLAAGVHFSGNWAEAESGAGAASGTGGRPD